MIRRGASSAQAPDSSLVTAQVGRLARLERELELACERYERAIAALDQRSAELLGHPQADDIVHAAMDAEPASADRPKSPDEYVTLTSASFADLRSLGLSVTQARRILKLRDDGVVASTAQLDSVPGLPQDQLAELKQLLGD